MNGALKSSVLRRIKELAFPVKEQASTAFIVHALHKSASMFLFKLFDELSRQHGLPLYSIHRNPPNHQDIPSTIDRSFFLCPIRSFEVGSFSFPQMDHKKHLVHVRDPRDILVSEYFSLGWLHRDEDWSERDKIRRQRIQQTSIDEFVLQESRFNQYPLVDRYRPILDLIHRPDVTIVQYEQMVTNFPEWLRKVFQFLGWEKRQRTFRKLVKQFQQEFEPGGPGSHKRNVVPGDHKNKLSASTIRQLDQQYSEILQALSYPIHSDG